MKLNTMLCGAAAGATLLASMAHPAQAWNQTVGSQVSSCSVTGTYNGAAIFTASTNAYSYVNGANQTVYTYRYDLANNGDASGLTSFSVNTGLPAASVADYFVGFGPNLSYVGSAGTALHDSNVGMSGSTVYAGQDGANVHPYTWSAVSNGGTVTFSDVTTPQYTPVAIKQGSSLHSQFQSTFNYNGSRTEGEYFFIQSLSQLTNTTLTVKDGYGYSGQIAGCDGNSSACGPLAITPTLNPNGGGAPAAVPEPGSVAAFLFGGMGLLGLTLRARRRAA